MIAWVRRSVIGASPIAFCALGDGATPMDTPSPSRSGTALIGFLAGIVLVLSGFVLGIVADRELFAPSAAPPPQAASAAIRIPTIRAVPTDTVPAGQPTSTPRPVPTPVPTVTPRPSDPA